MRKLKKVALSAVILLGVACSARFAVILRQHLDQRRAEEEERERTLARIADFEAIARTTQEEAASLVNEWWNTVDQNKIAYYLVEVPRAARSLKELMDDEGDHPTMSQLVEAVRTMSAQLLSNVLLQEVNEQFWADLAQSGTLASSEIALLRQGTAHQLEVRHKILSDLKLNPDELYALLPST